MKIFRAVLICIPKNELALFFGTKFKIHPQRLLFGMDILTLKKKKLSQNVKFIVGISTYRLLRMSIIYTNIF